MRVIDREQPKRKKKLPPISPRGFAADLTPSRHVGSNEPLQRVSREARGAAMLQRGSFDTYLKQRDDRLQPAEKKAVDLLRRNRHDLLAPKNQKYLSALQRTEPGTDLHKHIYSDPHLAHQHQLLKAGISVPPDARAQLLTHGLTNDHIDQLAAKQITPDQGLEHMRQFRVAQGQAKIPALAKKMGRDPSEFSVDRNTGGVIIPNVGDWTQRFLGGAADTVIGTAPFLYHMATTDPRKSVPEVGSALGHSFGETVQHPLRQLRKDPFTFFSNVGAFSGAGVGVGGRLSSLSTALAERGAGESAVGAAARGFTHPQVRTLLDLYEQKSPGAAARVRAQEADIAEQLRDTVAQPVAHIKGGVRGRLKATAQDVRQNLAATRRSDSETVKNIIEKNIHFVGPAAAHVGAAAGQGVRELLDGVRAGTIYLRPAYLPNNWAGNAFMNLTHQGAYAPINLAKSVYMHRMLTTRELRVLRTATGQTPISALHGTGRGYARALTDPVAQTMGRIADQPFRDAALFHELRRKGFNNLTKVKALARAVDNGDVDAERVMASAGRKAQEEIVKFGKMNDVERHVVRQVFFVYNWMKGATRYAARFPLAHPIQTSIYATGSKIGNEDVQRKIGGLPQYLVGSIPVGHGKMINPFTLNPLGTAVQVGRAAQGTLKELDPGRFGQFDPHIMEDWTSLLHPALQSAVEARENTGGRSYASGVLRNIAPYKLYHDLKHPGSGSVFPGTRREAIGHYVFGASYPRAFDPQALQTALERMNVNHPEALIPDQIKNYEKKTGQKIPPQLVAAYRRDLEELKAQKQFKRDYANQHNAPSYRRLPPINQAEAALTYIEQHHMLPPEQLQEFRQQLNDVHSDTVAKAFASAWWSMTNAGSAKRSWQSLMKLAKSNELTRRK